MAGDLPPDESDAPSTPKPAALPLSAWISVALSFVFVALGVTFVLWPAFWQFGRDLVAKESIASVGYVILAIGVILGLLNAFFYYSRTKAKLSSKS